jgi:carboxyl-terminal processing protease
MKKPGEHKRHTTNWAFLALQIGIIILSITVGYLGRWFLEQNKGDLNLLREARDILMKHTIIEIPESPALEYGMIQGMLTVLNDPYTYFVGPASTEVQSNELTGTYGGIGVRLERDMQSNWRLYPFPNSPARSAGILDGDLLVRIDNTDITIKSDETTIAAMMRGLVGETVNVTIDRNGETIIFKIERQAFEIPSVTYNFLPDFPDIGFIQVSRIAETTTSEIEKACLDLAEKGADAYILDLRNNTGGLVETGIDIAKLFLSEGEIIHRQFKDKQPEIFRIKETGPFTQAPMVILINNFTASAAEIIAGALSAHSRATLIGSPSFGKTTIQYIFTLQDGSSVHITSGRWWIPGITFPLIPDLQISPDVSENEIIQFAIDTLYEQ